MAISDRVGPGRSFLGHVFGKVAGYSALLGSLTCVIPNAFLALRLAVAAQGSGAQALVNAAWIGEIGKLALTVLFFTLVFTLVKPLHAAALFAGFIATQLVTFSGFLMRDVEQDTETAMAAEGGHGPLTSGDYIQHHLQNLQVCKAEAGEWVWNHCAGNPMAINVGLNVLVRIAWPGLCLDVSRSGEENPPPVSPAKCRPLSRSSSNS